MTKRKMKQHIFYVPEDFPNPKRMGSTKLFKALFGSPPRSTWAKWKKAGILPAPDQQIGTASFWWETTMARTQCPDAKTE